ncbi:helix-turn-helix transcriptional regulator [Paenibacillus lemnae]|uniref:AraC family transcriptional regulator n=1 Tax=Paenibacillus lemnae TaxID=1330551 RepID=A0A848MBX3_PAELE|nr:AraC family transcriptional regulator [Paenibacillus lemnae]NMO97681.1 AraC family transcriptional regulator [Paenibacillus lemnae]
MEFIEKTVCAWDEDSIRLFAMPSHFAKSHFLYVQEVGHFRTLPAYRTERASLRSYLICCTLSGRGYLQYEGQRHTLETGQAFFIDCMQHHEYETDPNELWEILWIHFNGPMCAAYYECFQQQNPVVFPAGNDSPIPNFIRDILDIQQRKDIRTDIQSSKIIMDMITEVLQSTITNTLGSSTVPEWLDIVTSYLDRHFRDKITLQELASMAALNKFQLSKDFKKYTGITPNEYIIRNRLSYAKELLTYSAYSIAEIARLSGIDNATHFINLFKARESMTPLSYRKKWRQHS